MEKHNPFAGIKDFLSGRFSLDEDNASQEEVMARIESGVVIRGINLWVLIFATFVASLGLNVNSTAVIIGAMLISPLMGPIMGMGVALGVQNFSMLKRSFKNFSFMIMISILTSTIYFLISPLTLVQSELLARTQPTTWDVLIALFGGLAGFVAQTRKDRTGTVIPGVAIATALMPPLCTAGFGIATGQWNYFAGAFYLFVINTVFIGIAAFLIVRFLNYKKDANTDTLKGRRVRTMMIFIITLTIVPSVFIGYNLVKTSIFEHNVKNYITKSFQFEETRVADFRFEYNPQNSKESIVEVFLLGDVLEESAVNALRVQMSNYGLYNTRLVVKQNKDVSSLSSSFIQANFEQLLYEKNSKIEDLTDELSKYKVEALPSAEISKEMSALFNMPIELSLNKSSVYNMNGEVVEQLLICYMKYSGNLSNSDLERLRNWLSARTSISNIKIFKD